MSELIKYKILPINQEDVEGYRSAVDSVARERKYLAFLEAPPMEMSRAFVLENIKQGRPHFVAFVEDKIVGWCDISSLHRPVFAHAGCLGIGVIDGYRGTGIGQALIKAALQKAKDIGLTRVELTVRENNLRAIALYKKFGFAIEGLHPNAVRIDGIYENHISMGLLL